MKTNEQVMAMLWQGICVFLFSLNTIKYKINNDNRRKCKQDPMSLYAQVSDVRHIHHKSIQVSKIQ